MVMIGRRFGNFEIIDEIGRGGMGVVYRAEQISLDRVVALKVLPDSMVDSDMAAERFHREALAMAKLSHPNIVDVIEVGEEDGVHYFAMQLMEGQSLTVLICRNGTLSPGQVAELGAQVADALAHAHQHGIVHRDIKPDNILLDSTGRAVVTDFGIARTAEDTSLTQTGAAIGAPDYMSPESLRGNPLDGRTDLYSLGVVLFQMVTGQVPFSATTPFEVANRHLNEQPPAPSTIRAECPDWLESIILKALAKEPADRFASAAEMAAALRAGRPVQRSERGPAHDPPPPPRPANPIAAVWALAAVGALLVVAAIVWAVAGSRAEGVSPNGGEMTEVGDFDVPDTPIPPAERQVHVPDVVGLAEERATDAIEEAGLRVAECFRRHDSSVPAGCVALQRPVPGDRVTPGSGLHLTLSLGPDRPTSPDEVIAAYHRRLTQRDFGGAWELFTPSHQQKTGWQDWINGFDDTVRSVASQFETIQQGSDYAKIHCLVEFEDNVNGRFKRGNVQHTYTLRRVGGDWRIDSRGAVRGTLREY